MNKVPKAADTGTVVNQPDYRAVVKQRKLEGQLKKLTELYNPAALVSRLAECLDSPTRAWTN